MYVPYHFWFVYISSKLCQNLHLHCREKWKMNCDANNTPGKLQIAPEKVEGHNKLDYHPFLRATQKV